jgi:hypothetical protein
MFVLLYRYAPDQRWRCTAPLFDTPAAAWDWINANADYHPKNQREHTVRELKI